MLRNKEYFYIQTIKDDLNKVQINEFSITLKSQESV